MHYHRKTSFLVALVAVLISGVIISSSAVAKAKSWHTFSSAKGRFSVDMPGKPEIYHKAEHTKIGVIGGEFYKYRTKHMTLTVEYTDIPGFVAVFGGRHKVYKKAKQEFLKIVGGTQSSFINISMDGIRGKELFYKTSARDGRALFLMENRRLYVVQASIVKSASDKSDVDKFIFSFRPIYTAPRESYKHFDRREQIWGQAK